MKNLLKVSQVNRLKVRVDRLIYSLCVSDRVIWGKVSILFFSLKKNFFGIIVIVL